MLDGRVRSVDAATLGVETALGELVLPARAATGARTGEALVPGDVVGVCFRPEHVRVGAAIGPDSVRFDARLVDVAFFGTHRRARLAFGRTRDDAPGDRSGAAAPGPSGDAGGGTIEVLAHLPQAEAVEPGAALTVGVPRDAFVVLARGAGPARTGPDA